MRFAPLPLLLLLLSLLLGGCGEKPASELRAGDELYRYYCDACHARDAEPGPIELRDRGLQHHELVLMVRYGNGRHRPVFRQLSPQQADTLASYTLKIITEGDKR